MVTLEVVKLLEVLVLAEEVEVFVRCVVVEVLVEVKLTLVKLSSCQEALSEVLADTLAFAASA